MTNFVCPTWPKRHLLLSGRPISHLWKLDKQGKHLCDYQSVNLKSNKRIGKKPCRGSRSWRSGCRYFRRSRSASRRGASALRCGHRFHCIQQPSEVKSPLKCLLFLVSNVTTWLKFDRTRSAPTKWWALKICLKTQKSIKDLQPET